MYRAGAETIHAQALGSTTGMALRFELLFLLRVGERVTLPVITPSEPAPAKDTSPDPGRGAPPGK